MPGVRLTKPFAVLDGDHLAQVGGHMGVYELAEPDGEVVFIGMAGARSPFGLRGELRRHLERGTAPRFRLEVTTAYLSRYRELLMAHLHDHGRLPRLNPEDAGRVGRLSPG